jgi:hypothetical protein
VQAVADQDGVEKREVGGVREDTGLDEVVLRESAVGPEPQAKNKDDGD